MRRHRPAFHRPKPLLALGHALLLGCAVAALPAMACDTPVYAQYRSQPPLLGTTPDTALQVAMHVDGCVAVRFPKQDVRAGTHVWQAPKQRWLSLRAEVEASGVALLDAGAIKQRLKSAAEARAKAGAGADDGPLLYVTADENILEFVLAADADGKQLRALNWTTLHADQLNLPHDPDLARIAALRTTFEELAAETHREGTQR